MTQSRVITATFSGQTFALSASSGGSNGLTAQGFKFTVVGDPGSVYQIQRSTNHTSWQNAGLITNGTGETQFTDPAATNVPATYYRTMLVTP
jgi:hypothetical protein